MLKRLDRAICSAGHPGHLLEREVFNEAKVYNLPLLWGEAAEGFQCPIRGVVLRGFEEDTRSLIPTSFAERIETPVARDGDQPRSKRSASSAKAVDALDRLEEDLAGDVFRKLFVSDLGESDTIDEVAVFFEDGRPCRGVAFAQSLNHVRPLVGIASPGTKSGKRQSGGLIHHGTRTRTNVGERNRLPLPAGKQCV